MHMPHDSHAQSIDRVKASYGCQREDKKILQFSQLCQHNVFWHISVSERQQSQLCGQNLCGPFVGAVLATNVKVEEST